MWVWLPEVSHNPEVASTCTSLEPNGGKYRQVGPTHAPPDLRPWPITWIVTHNLCIWLFVVLGKKSYWDQWALQVWENIGQETLSGPSLPCMDSSALPSSCGPNLHPQQRPCQPPRGKVECKQLVLLFAPVFVCPSREEGYVNRQQ